jgi:uncharacterized protein (TIGR02001 family)
MKRLSLGVAAALVLFAGQAAADGLSTRGSNAEAPETRTCSTTANVGLTTNYVFRGLSQTLGDAAVQGGVDFSCGRFYGGVWGSNVEFVEPVANVEIDIYGGFKHTTGPVTWDVGFIYYTYPGQASGFDLDYLELKLGASGDIWRGGTLGGTVFYTPEYFNHGGTAWTLEGTFTQALPKVGMLSPSFSATLGRVNFRDDEIPSYTYWNVGLTLGLLEKWSLDMRYWDNDLEFCPHSICDSRIVGSVKYRF